MISYRNVSFVVLLFLNSAYAKPNCIQDVLQSIHGAKLQIESKYDRFKNYSDQAHEFYSSLEVNEKSFLAKLRFLESEKTPEQMQVSLMKQINEAGELSVKQKKNLIEKLKINAPNADQAMENFRQNYEYLFWTDHSQVHMQDILNKSLQNAKKWPKGFVKPYQNIIQNKVWKERMDWAIRLHDSNMHHSRALHAEMVLAARDLEFPAHFNPSEKIMISVLSMLHSKSLIPYSQLPRWPEILETKLIPNLLSKNILTPERASEIKQWVQHLDAQERDEMVKAASWIRMSDADRPIGASLKNSSGDFYSLNPKTDEVFVEHRGEKILIIQSQYKSIYGQVVMENVRIVPDSNQGFIAEFKLRTDNAFHKELKQLPILKWIEEGTASANIANYSSQPQLQSILHTIVSIVDDFPPKSFTAIQITH